MPNRVIRDWTISETMNTLSVHAEVFFVRLIMKADDYGSFHANVKLLKANLYPLRLDQVRETDISRWMAECQKAGLIAFYDAEGKPYLRIINFGQRTRNMKKRFPEPEMNDGQVAASCGELPPETRNEKPKRETETEKDADALIDSNKKNENKKNLSSAPEITMPFGDDFSKLWGEWKDYKVREFKFHHKSPQSEQASLNELIKLGNGIEENCNKIIIQSMANTWKGFFELKDIKNGKTTNTGKQAVDVQSALDKLSRMS